MYHFIVNPNSRSGRGLEIWKQLHQELHTRNIPHISHLTAKIGHATEIAQALTSTGEKITLVVLGGDGTVNEVLNGIRNHPLVTLGYIPTGSSNDLARSLGISKAPLKAFEHVLQPKLFSYMDAGTVTLGNKTSRSFAVSCGIGFDAAVCKTALTSKTKGFFNSLKLGKLTYAAIALQQILFYKPVKGSLLLDGIRKIPLTQVCFISSHIHKYEGGGLMLCPNADSEDGLLDLCVINGLPKLKILFMLPTAFKGNHIHIKGVSIYRCKKADISMETPLPIHTDGEVVSEETKISVTCEKTKLRIIIA